MMPFGLKIAVINRAFRKKLDEKASSMGLTAVQLRVLGSVSRLEAAGEAEIHQNDLERLEHITHPAMTKHLNKLEEKGFIRCLPSRQDRRYKTVQCTARSTGIHHTILDQDAAVFSELCQGMTPAEQAALCRGIDAILKNIHIDTE